MARSITSRFVRNCPETKVPPSEEAEEEEEEEDEEGLSPTPLLLEDEDEDEAGTERTVMAPVVASFSPWPPQSVLKYLPHLHSDVQSDWYGEASQVVSL